MASNQQVNNSNNDNDDDDSKYDAEEEEEEEEGSIRKRALDPSIGETKRAAALRLTPHAKSDKKEKESTM